MFLRAPKLLTTVLLPSLAALAITSICIGTWSLFGHSEPAGSLAIILALLLLVLLYLAHARLAEVDEISCDGAHALAATERRLRVEMKGLRGVVDVAAARAERREMAESRDSAVARWVGRISEIEARLRRLEEGNGVGEEGENGGGGGKSRPEDSGCGL